MILPIVRTITVLLKPERFVLTINELFLENKAEPRLGIEENVKFYWDDQRRGLYSSFVQLYWPSEKAFEAVALRARNPMLPFAIVEFNKKGLPVKEHQIMHKKPLLDAEFYRAQILDNNDVKV